MITLLKNVRYNFALSSLINWWFHTEIWVGAPACDFNLLFVVFFIGDTGWGDGILENERLNLNKLFLKGHMSFIFSTEMYTIKFLSINFL